MLLESAPRSGLEPLAAVRLGHTSGPVKRGVDQQRKRVWKLQREAMDRFQGGRSTRGSGQFKNRVLGNPWRNSPLFFTTDM